MAREPRGSRSKPRRARASRRARPHVLRPPLSVGINIPRLEAHDKVTGHALYVDDLAVPGMLHGRTVRSAIARGIIKKIELDPAFDWSGVVVADYRDIPGENVLALIEDDQPLLAAREIRHAEEPIVLVAHADPERAEAARRAVRIQVEPLEPVLTVEDSLARKALIYGSDNVFKRIEIARGDLARGFAEADLVVEDLAATTKRHPSVSRIRAGVKRDGTLTAWEMDIVMDGGAYLTLSPVVLSRGAIHAGGPYRCPNVAIHARAVATHTPPNGAFRGFGATQTQFATECHMDRIAQNLGLDPYMVRRANAYRAGDVTPTGQTLRESVGAVEVLERAARRAGY